MPATIDRHGCLDHLQDDFLALRRVEGDKFQGEEDVRLAGWVDLARQNGLAILQTHRERTAWRKAIITGVEPLTDEDCVRDLEQMKASKQMLDALRTMMPLEGSAADHPVMHALRGASEAFAGLIKHWTPPQLTSVERLRHRPLSAEQSQALGQIFDGPSPPPLPSNLLPELTWQEHLAALKKS